MIDDEAETSRVNELLEQILESGQSPEEACLPCPELLPKVRDSLQQLRKFEEQMGAIFPRSHSSQPEAVDLQSPTELPAVEGYEVIDIVGRGGMGVVFQARDLRLNRLVAIKMILSGHYALPSQRERFLREAEAIAAISHPHIVQVFNAGESAGRPWFAMELVEGGSLADKIKGKPQGASESATLLARVADGIAVAHRHGIIHRDLKPGNVLLTVDGTPKVTDFGLARWVHDENITVEASTIGTPSYMAPEQARGDSRAVGPATDVYALGAILYELLTGRPPFRGETAVATVQQVLTIDVVPPSRLNSHIPRDLQTICLKCLDKDPVHRYPTAAGLAEDLSRFLAHEPIHARPLGPIGRSLRFARRRPAHAALLVGSILAASALVIGVLQRHAQIQAETMAVQTDLHEAEQFGRSADWVAANAALDRAQARVGGTSNVLLQQVGGARDRIDRARRRAELLQRIEHTRWTRVTRVEGRFNPQAETRYRNERADHEYASAFTAAGLGVPGDDAAYVASRIAALDVVAESIVALDDWRVCAAERSHRDWLADILRRLDPDPWRNRARDKVVWEDGSALLEVSRTADVARQRTDFLISLAERLGQVSPADAVGFLRHIQQVRRTDFLANFALGNVLIANDPQHAAEFYREAVNIRPDSLPALNNLGLAQADAYVIPESTETFLVAMRDKEYGAAVLNNFGVMFKFAGNYPLAEAFLREAINADSDSAEARCNLADILAQSGAPGVTELLRAAVTIDPQFARAHYLLGIALCARGPVDEAHAIQSGRREHWGPIVEAPIAYYHSAYELDPAWIPTTQDRARLADAIAEYQLAIKCDPLLSRAHAALAQALCTRGEFDVAIKASRRAIETQNDPHAVRLGGSERTALARQLQRCQHLADLHARLPSMLDGSAAPADARESLEFAEICLAKGMNAAAGSFYLRAFEADAALAADEKAGHRYRAACAAALAESEVTGDPDARWRRQSRQWLDDELAQYSARLQKSDWPNAARTYFALSHWLGDPALSSIRDEAMLVRLPPADAERCRHLWSQVATVRRKAESIVDQSAAAPGCVPTFGSRTTTATAQAFTQQQPPRSLSGLIGATGGASHG